MSAKELVEAARARGLDWSAVIGMRTDQGLEDVPESREGFHEVWVDSRTIPRRFRAVHKILDSHPSIKSADVVVSLIPMSDIMLARKRATSSRKWVAFVRGLPWPDYGETSWLRRKFWLSLESRALKAADEVWATTTILSEQISAIRKPIIVPAGIKPVPHVASQHVSGGNIVWAGRMAVDKNPGLFLEMMSQIEHPAVMYGGGAMRDRLAQAASANVTVSGWAKPDELWRDARVFVGTSSREAFGRSAVEAAFSGLPVILGDGYGAARLLIKDPDLYSRFVLPITKPNLWIKALRDLLADEELSARLANHVRENAQQLTIQASVDAINERLENLLAPAKSISR
jgi:glycosyltransferase involved in cell wall biosynthesis